jgi:hypothetical protein
MKRIRIAAALGFLALAATSLMAQAPSWARQNRAFFEFGDVTKTNKFVMMLRDRAKIRQARAILAGRETESTHVGGVIVKKRAWYNPRWRYHLAPDSIEFFGFAIEVCDANMQYVQEHLREVGGAFLPDNRWCPWSSKLVRAIPMSRIRR